MAMWTRSTTGITAGITTGITAGVVAAVAGVAWGVEPAGVALVDGGGVGLIGHAMDDGGVVASPLMEAARVGPGGARLVVDPAAMEAMSGRRFVTLAGLPVGPGVTADVSLERFDVLAPDAVVEVWTGGGDGAGAGERVAVLERPSVVMYRGHVVGEPGTLVFLALTPGGRGGGGGAAGQGEAGGLRVEGFVRWSEGVSILGTDGAGVVSVVDTRVAGGGEIGAGWSCGGALPKPADAPPRGDLPVLGGEDGGDGGGWDARVACRRFDLALDADVEFVGRFGGNATAASNYITVLMGATSAIYDREVDFVFGIGNIRVWTGSDPWTHSNIELQLEQYQSWHVANGTGPRAAGHLVSGRNLGGGIAYLSQLCSRQMGFAVSANMNGFFPVPVVNNSGQNWDLMVFAHEMGHVVGSPHTHDGYDPPIDGCGSGDCAVAVVDQGTIMSYCHLCSGGLQNVRMELGPRVSERIRGFTGLVSCGTALETVVVTQPPADVTLCTGQGLNLSVQATGQDLRYQWYRNGFLIPGATGPTYTVASVSPSQHNGQYHVVVSDVCRSVSTQGLAGGRVTVSNPPSLGLPIASQTVAAGSEVQLSAVFGGPSLVYSWTRNGQPVLDGGRISGATTASLRIVGARPEDQGTYVVSASNACGSRTMSATLTVTGPVGCRADVDGSGGIPDVDDVVAFFEGFAAGLPLADVDGSGGIPDVDDIVVFFEAFAAGC